MDEVNRNWGIKKLVVMDVCKMFPSMVAADVARVVREEYKSARLEVRSATQNLAQTRKGKKTTGKDFRKSA